LVLMVAFLGSLAFAAIRARVTGRGAHAGLAGGLGAAFVVYLFHAGVDWMWESTAVTLLAILAGATAAASRSKPAARARWPLRASLVAGAIVLALVQLPPLVSTSEIRKSQDAFRRHDVETAFDKANQAIDAEPWAASPYVQRGLLSEATGDLGAAGTDVGRAARYEPTNWRHPLLLARIEAERGNARLALEEYRRARGLRPASAFVNRP
jgi:tetratricopeptide (TPR) repeat protein